MLHVAFSPPPNAILALRREVARAIPRPAANAQKHENCGRVRGGRSSLHSSLFLRVHSRFDRPTRLTGPWRLTPGVAAPPPAPAARVYRTRAECKVLPLHPPIHHGDVSYPRTRKFLLSPHQEVYSYPRTGS